MSLPLVLAMAALVAPPANDPAAERVGRRVYAAVAALHRLPRFDYQARYRWGNVLGMPAEERAGLDELTRAQTGDISRARGDGVPWYELEFAWDEARVVTGLRPGEADLNFSHVLVTRAEGWHRGERDDRSSRTFGRFRGDGKAWGYAVGTTPYYLRVAPSGSWWDATRFSARHSLGVTAPAWAGRPGEAFAGEPCEVVEAVTADGPVQRLWASRATGRLRGLLTFHWNGGQPTPDQLVRFDDYREAAPGVWVPFAESRTEARVSKTAGKFQLIRAELRVVSARHGADLSDRFAALLPKPGDRVNDWRFAAPVVVKHDPSRPDADIQKEADAEHAKRLADAELVKELLKPLDKLVGRPAPPLPADGWVGGPRPDLAGKPHLRHFWATWCGPCKNDLPALAKLAADGVAVVGLHPAGTPAAEVAKAAAEHKLPYPTLVAAGRDTVAGHPVGLFPYYVMVDAAGTVVGHGPLAEVLAKHGGLLRGKP